MASKTYSFGIPFDPSENATATLGRKLDSAEIEEARKAIGDWNDPSKPLAECLRELMSAFDAQVKMRGPFDG